MTNPVNNQSTSLQHISIELSDQTSHLQTLPIELLTKIYLLLEMKDEQNFKLVCKKFYSFSSALRIKPKFIRAHLNYIDAIVEDKYEFSQKKDIMIYKGAFVPFLCCKDDVNKILQEITPKLDNLVLNLRGEDLNEISQLKTKAANKIKNSPSKIICHIKMKKLIDKKRNKPFFKRYISKLDKIEDLMEPFEVFLVKKNNIPKNIVEFDILNMISSYMALTQY